MADSRRTLSPSAAGEIDTGLTSGAGDTASETLAGLRAISRMGSVLLGWAAQPLSALWRLAKGVLRLGFRILRGAWRAVRARREQGIERSVRPLERRRETARRIAYTAIGHADRYVADEERRETLQSEVRSAFQKYDQALEGDIGRLKELAEERPGRFDFRGRAELRRELKEIGEDAKARRTEFNEVLSGVRKGIREARRSAPPDTGEAPTAPENAETSEPKGERGRATGRGWLSRAWRRRRSGNSRGRTERRGPEKKERPRQRNPWQRNERRRGTHR
ncbi:hypothetical protein J0910_18945 [Nocardiopsis sp. CNT-189]|uniref:hypothetical protein n=1 Tax=Nocardiopsis oceanisediminis TaxID=2816862 RepID=UPI003B30BCF8